MDMISLAELRTALSTGGLRAVGVTASGGLFFVTAQPRSGGWLVLATTRGKQARGFRDPGKAIFLLHSIGAQKIAVDVSGWDSVRAATEGRRRPDISARQRRMHKLARVELLRDGVGEDEGAG